MDIKKNAAKLCAKMGISYDDSFNVAQVAASYECFRLLLDQLEADVAYDPDDGLSFVECKYEKNSHCVAIILHHDTISFKSDEWALLSNAMQFAESFKVVKTEDDLLEIMICFQL